MKSKMLYFIAFMALLASIGCSKKFLEEIQPYNQYSEDQVYSNETLAGEYIDRLYNYYFVSYNSPLKQVVGLYNDNRSRMTEELGGTVINYTNPTLTLQLATDGDGYYGVGTSSITNNPYTRIRIANDILTKVDQPVAQNLSASFRKTAKGQMYLLRALQYYDLVRVYGGVPIVTTVSDPSTTDTTLRIPRSKASDCFAQIVKDLDSAAALLPMQWDAVNYGRLTAAAALATKSRVLLTAASPLFNTDWDNSGNAKWQAALQAGLDAETKLTAGGYGLYGSNARDWAAMTYAQANNTTFNKEAIMVFLFSTNTVSSAGYNNAWENSLRPADYKGGGGIAATKEMLDLFPLATGVRPTKANGYVDTFFFENRDPRFYRTFAFSGSKWGIKSNANRSTWLYRWKANATATTATYYGNNQTNSPAVVAKMSNPAADSVIGFTYSGTSIFEYRYAELLLNIAECYAAKGDVGNTLLYLGKIRGRVGIPSVNNYGIGTLANKYAAIEACLYERRVELAYEGKRFWDVQRWMLYDNIAANGNSVTKLGLSPINGTVRNGYYWQSITYGADPLTATDRNILVDPDAANFTTQIGNLKTLYRNKFVMTKLDQGWDRVNNADLSAQGGILFRPNYYLSGLASSPLSSNPWLKQNTGWNDYSGVPGTFNATE